MLLIILYDKLFIFRKLFSTFFTLFWIISDSSVASTNIETSSGNSSCYRSTAKVSYEAKIKHNFLMSYEMAQ